MENIPWFSFDTCAQGQHTQEQSQRQQVQQQHIPSPPSPLHLVSHDYHDQRLDTDDSYHDQRLDTDDSLLGTGVLSDSLSSDALKQIVDKQ